MKRLLSVFVSVFLCHAAFSQVIISSTDMPVSGDTLRYSTSSPIGAVINAGDSGISSIWNYALTCATQGIDTYKSAFAVNPLYAFTIGPTAYGYKVADSFPGPVSIHNVYTFFECNSDSFVAQAFAANVFGVPTPSNYAPADVWYRFPLTYKSMDSSGYELDIAVPGVGGIHQQGYRETRVDGWGILITPYTSGVQCIRVRSIKYEMDSVTFGTTGFPPVPRNTVEYKWLASGEHYPLLWVTSTLSPTGSETITSIRYRDVYRDTTTVPPIDTNVAVQNVKKKQAIVNAFPNPAPDGVITLSIPASWKTFLVELYDMHAREVGTYADVRQLDLRELPAGNYLARVTSGIDVAYVKITR